MIRNSASQTFLQNSSGASTRHSLYCAHTESEHETDVAAPAFRGVIAAPVASTRVVVAAIIIVRMVSSAFYPPLRVRYSVVGSLPGIAVCAVLGLAPDGAHRPAAVPPQDMSGTAARRRVFRSHRRPVPT